jgi:hypothetical protein
MILSLTQVSLCAFFISKSEMIHISSYAPRFVSLLSYLQGFQIKKLRICQHNGQALTALALMPRLTQRHRMKTLYFQYTKLTNKMQMCRIIYYSLVALHVSSDIFAHHQKHLNCITASGITHVFRCQLVSWECWN